MLVDKGILAKRRGIGMFVEPGARELLTERRAAFADRFIQPLIAEARTLGSAPTTWPASFRSARPQTTWKERTMTSVIEVQHSPSATATPRAR
jgi:DNA-binding transcriptional regulator YhcF (GntR family)